MVTEARALIYYKVEHDFAIHNVQLFSWSALQKVPRICSVMAPLNLQAALELIISPTIIIYYI